MNRIAPTTLQQFGQFGTADAAIDLFRARTETVSHYDAFEVVRGLKTAVWVYDIDKCSVVLANASALKLWQAETEDDLKARDLSKGMSASVSTRLKQYQRDFRERDCSFNELWTLYPNGVPTTEMVIYRGFLLPDGRMGMLCEVPGTTEYIPENIRSAEALLHTDVMIMLFAENGETLYMNPAARNTNQSSLQGFRRLFVDLEEHDDILLAVMERGQLRKVTQVRTTDGYSWYDLSVKTCTDAVTGDPAILVTAVDVSELKTARDKARYLADCDQLTGCFNRAYFTRMLDRIATSENRQGLALVYFDLDRFKQINDQFGHEVGDAVLCVTTKRLQALLGAEDLLARFGGDEFVVLLSDVADENSLRARIDTIQKAIGEPVHHGSSRFLVTCSMGGALIPEKSMDWSEHMKRADIALYDAKQGGRDKFSVFNEEMGRAASERYQIEKELKSALEEEQFTLYYQPRVDTVSGKVASVEALVRWIHPERGLVPPNDFIPICEETGMIEELGYFVMKRGCEQAMEWQKAGLDIGMSINVSPRQFLDKRLMENITELSQHPDFPTGKVELEITETVLIGDHDLIAERLQQITDLGFKLAIDDFGTGYSNLAYISRFPLDCIKIDKSFVDQLPTSGPIIKLVQTLADQVGASTVAEGVETYEQVEILREIGCGQLQGYHYSRPLPVSEVVDRIHEIAANATE
jgi:diguanylate cyclase (GGDEF)-like protein